MLIFTAVTLNHDDSRKWRYMTKITGRNHGDREYVINLQYYEMEMLQSLRPQTLVSKFKQHERYLYLSDAMCIYNFK